ncbi:MAG: sigma-70 family RNA polymerase sigma factor [Bryobacteraceae bacterium]|nr:sigma-70 family RNA polymerase sigma factor [Bryobacteraceae bacterium]
MYWQPCLRYVQLRFRCNEEAQDLVQGFFTALLEQKILAHYDAERGPFRPYLRACLDQFVLKHLERNRREKRGGRATLIPLENDALLAARDDNPEEIFHREWQRHMFTLAVEELRQLCAVTDRNLRYELFAAYDLAEEPRPSYADLAGANDLPVTTVTNHLAWARRELRRLLEARLGTLSNSDTEPRRELRSLLKARSV